MKFRVGLGILCACAMAVWAAQQGAAPKKGAPSSVPPAAAAPSQTAPAGPVLQSDELARIQVDVTRVQMLFTVMDKRGRFISDLNKDDFEVIESKKSQAVQEFTAESDLPLRLGILIDTSNSIRERFRFEQDAAVEFLKTVMRSNLDKAMLVSFDTKAELVTDLLDNPDRLEDGIRRLRPGGGTALYDAIFYACRDKLAMDQPKHKFRRAIVMVSDGEDNQSEVTKAQAIEMAQRAEVIIYAISTDDSGLVLRGDRVLEQLAEATGGRAFFPFKMKDITHSFAAIEDELRSQYVVSYKPADFDADGRYRSIEISSLKKDTQVRARKGYFAPQQ